jgi:hypothetical protein
MGKNRNSRIGNHYPFILLYIIISFDSLGFIGSVSASMFTNSMNGILSETYPDGNSRRLHFGTVHLKHSKRSISVRWIITLRILQFTTTCYKCFNTDSNQRTWMATEFIRDKTNYFSSKLLRCRQNMLILIILQLIESHSCLE